jgi:cytochrome bd ubiquinol oxidase subunit II
VRSDVRSLFDDLTSGAGLACVLVSGAAGLVTLWLEWRERFEVARYTAALAVAAVVAGWAVAQQPYLLPPELTVEEAAAPDATLLALLIGTALGMLILIPALAWLFRLALSGRIAYEDKPRP